MYELQKMCSLRNTADRKALRQKLFPEKTEHFLRIATVEETSPRFDILKHIREHKHWWHENQLFCSDGDYPN